MKNEYEKNERILRMLGEADSRLIEEAAPENHTANRPANGTHAWVKWASAAACVCLLAIGAIGIGVSGVLQKETEQNTEDRLWGIKEVILETAPSVEVGTAVPRWEEMTVSQQYFSAEWKSVSYSSRVTEISADHIEQQLGTAVMKGMDAYTETEHTAEGTVYSLRNISEDCAVAVQFEDDTDYYVYVNPFYAPVTLGQFIEDLNLKEIVSFGSVWYSYFQQESSVFKTVEFVDLEDTVVWNMLLSDETLENVYDNCEGVTVMSVSVDIPLLGYENIGLWVTEDGYLVTNILDTGKAFYIGQERVQQFVDYVVGHCQGYEIVYVDAGDAVSEAADDAPTATPMMAKKAG